jgi:phosphoglycerate dehydrogenase-like enzyme
MAVFNKLVAIEPTRLLPEWDAKLSKYARNVRLYEDIPADNAEIIRRIGDADCVLLSYTSRIDKDVLIACPGIRYIGMCCSLYSPESANVDILTARERGITVTGIRDYGDEGVAEYVISELVRLLHGLGGVFWKDEAVELTDIDVGILGMGATGTLVARALRFFGAKVYYFSRTRKPALEEKEAFVYLPLTQLLPKVEILCTCLNKNVTLLGPREFALFGDGKILINTSIGPSHDLPALRKWLKNPGNYALCDSAAGIGGEEIQALSNVFCGTHPAGLTSLAKQRLARKVIANIESNLPV